MKAKPLIGACLAMGLVIGPGARAGDPAEPARPDLSTHEPPALQPGWLPAAGALLPGLVVHGLGHVIGGDRQGGLTLMGIEGAGIGLMGGGLASIAWLGASRKLIGPLYAATLTGLGLWTISGAADLYGSVFAGRPPGAPEREHSWLTLRVGYTWVYDPRFSTGNLAELEATTWLWGARLEPRALIGLDADEQRLRLEAAWRILGPAGPACGPAADGSYLELSLAADWQRHAADGFSILGLEAWVLGRYDLERLLPSLAGSFAELGLGGGLELFGYQALGGKLGEDAETELLMRFAFGIYLGSPGQRWGELRFYYDHRHDDLAGGLTLGFGGDGMGGLVGLGGHLWLSPSWGLAADLRAGSAWVASIALLWRLGDEP